MEMMQGPGVTEQGKQAMHDFTKSPTPTGQSIQFDVHTKKIGEDVERGGKAVGEKIHDLMDKKDGEKPPSPR